MNNIITERLAINLLDYDSVDIHDMFTWHEDKEILRYLRSGSYMLETDFKQSMMKKNIFIAKLKNDNNQVVCYCRVGNTFTWVCNPKYRGNGYTAEMLSAIINTFGLRNIIARIDSRNIASQKVAEKVGFIRVSLPHNQNMYEYIYK